MLSCVLGKKSFGGASGFAADIERGRAQEYSGRMNRIDETKPFKPVNIAVLTVSDTRTLETDKSGVHAGRTHRARRPCPGRPRHRPDDVGLIRAQVQKWIDDPRIEVVISTGGTGVTAATSRRGAGGAVREEDRRVRRKPSAGSASRRSAPRPCRAAPPRGSPMAPTSSRCGLDRACKDGWDDILRQQLDIRFRPCNFAELMPPPQRRQAAAQWLTSSPRSARARRCRRPGRRTAMYD